MAWGCGVVHADGSGATLGEACALMGMLGCAILIPGPPGLLGVFQAGLVAIAIGSGAGFAAALAIGLRMLVLTACQHALGGKARIIDQDIDTAIAAGNGQDEPLQALVISRVELFPAK